MRESFFKKKSYFSAAEKWWNEQDQGTHNVIIGGVSALVIFFAGGIVLHAALTGLAVNAFFWYGMWNPDMKAWMQEYGRKLDIFLTVGSIGAAIFVGATVGLSLMFIAGFFSLIRRALCPTIAAPAVQKDETLNVDDDIIDVEFTEVK